jgi:hypothetical protein
MTVAEIYALARVIAGTDSTGLPDATAQSLLRIAYRDLVNTIKTQINEDYFYDEWTADTVATQREYTLPARTSSVAGCNKVLGISVLPSSTATEYVKCTEMSIGALPQDLSRYSTEQSASEPFYVISDNSVFIYPTPSESVTGGLKIYGVADPIDPSTGGAESTVKIPLEHHEALSHGLAYWHFVTQQRTERIMESKARFDEAKRFMISSLTDRTTTPKKSILPDLTVLG